MNRPTELHLQAIKRILRYIKGTLEYGVMYQARMGGLIGYTDSDYARDTDDRRSTSGYVFMLSNGAVSWLSKKQPIVTLSTTEAEFVAAAGCSSQAIWLMRVLEKLGCASKEGVTIYCDNSSTMVEASTSITSQFTQLCELQYSSTKSTFGIRARLSKGPDFQFESDR
ncbi:hypothetical protein Tco_0838346 [Tanacetum coccineum]|uniref:Uncharacterized protein n=1 Tax=Tanacetum coccineum TaxID=301880 RepID=A0ABQ5AS33_9ASTR